MKKSIGKSYLIDNSPHCEVVLIDILDDPDYCTVLDENNEDRHDIEVKRLFPISSELKIKKVKP